jgi:hypothetical protein
VGLPDGLDLFLDFGGLSFHAFEPGFVLGLCCGALGRFIAPFIDPPSHGSRYGQHRGDRRGDGENYFDGAHASRPAWGCVVIQIVACGVSFRAVKLQRLRSAKTA